MANIISGIELSAKLKASFCKEVQALKAKGVVPGLGVILVGDNPASHSYVTAKEQDCKEVGILSKDCRLSSSTTQEELLAIIEEMNNDPTLHGILVQLPLPKTIEQQKIIYAISPQKDVDGFHPVSIGKMVLGEETFLPCTPHGVIKLLEFANIPTQAKEVVIIGRSNIVGKPLANLLLRRGLYGDATVSVCHSATPDIAKISKQADILIVAVGSPNIVTANMVKPGAIVIDVGVNRIPDSTKKSGFRLCGDVDFESVKEVAKAITPVPGGVGPMTRTMLLYNIIQSAKRSLLS